MIFAILRVIAILIVANNISFIRLDKYVHSVKLKNNLFDFQIFLYYL